jgi:Flp pilus assembly protein TadG
VFTNLSITRKWDVAINLDDYILSARHIYVHFADNNTQPQRQDRSFKARVLRRGGRVRAGQEGQSLIEFALCLPVLLLVLCGIGVFGVIIFQKMTLHDATVRAAMTLASYGTNQGALSLTADPCAAAYSAFVADAASLTPTKATFSYTINALPTAPATTGTTFTTSTCTSAPTLQAGDIVTVTVTYPCSMVIYGVNYWTSGTCTLTETQLETIE